MTEYFERIDKFSAWNLWRLGEDAVINRYDHAHKRWEFAHPDFRMFDPKVSRPISIERVEALIKIGI